MYCLVADARLAEALVARIDVEGAYEQLLRLGLSEISVSICNFDCAPLKLSTLSEGAWDERN